jgi:hypothetical protein
MNMSAVFRDRNEEVVRERNLSSGTALPGVGGAYVLDVGVLPRLDVLGIRSMEHLFFSGDEIAISLHITEIYRTCL